MNGHNRSGSLAVTVRCVNA